MATTPEFPAASQRYQDVHHCPRCGASYAATDFVAAACLFACRGCGFHFYQNPVPAAVAVLVCPARPREVLLLRRRTPPAVGRWCVPGGFIGYGERPEAAVVREVREEVGLAVSVRQLLRAGLVDYRFQGRQLCILELGYVVTPDDPAAVDVARIATDEAVQARFFALDDLLAEPGLLAFPEQAALLADYRASLPLTPPPAP